VDGRPIVIGTHHFSADRFPGIAEALHGDSSITRALARSGVQDYRRQSTRIIARMPTAEEARLLEQSRNRPVLVTEAVNIDAEGQAVEISLARYAAGRIQLLVEI
jgi:GntR family phosphonate transport system transcriptional regulator